MANDIDKTSPHYKGDFGSIYEVNKKFPTGGVAGDFVVIEGWAHYWNADRASWCVNAERDSYWDELITNIIEKFKLVRGATYMGVANLGTVPEKIIGAKLYYFATEAGTYKNFGNLVVPQGINVLYSENGSSWVNTTLLEVDQELGVSTKKVVSQKALNDALNLKANQSFVNEALAKKADKEEMNRLLGTKANTSDVNTKFTEEKTRVDAELDKKFDKASIAQETGEAEDKVMSQKAVSTKLSDLADNTEIRNEDGATIKTPFREIESPEFLHCIVDAEDRFLFGIRLDGSIDWSVGVPAPIRAKLQEIINQCQQDKTDVLDAINSVKEELTASITALQKGKVDKEEGKSLIEDEVKECFRVIENEEFIMAVVDSEDRVLFGIYRATGKPYYPLNEMYHVEQNEEFFALWLDSANHVLFGIRRDGEIIGEIHAVNALKQVISQLQSDLTSLQEKVGTIDTNLKELLDVFSLQDNEEFLAVEQDAEGRVLSSTNADGSHYIYNAKSETIPEEFSHIEDPEGRTEITTDAENKILGYRDSEGTRHEHKISVDHLDLSDEAAKEVNDAFKSAGIKMENPSDFSKDSHIELPIPRIVAQVRIYAPKLPTTKQDDIEAEIEYNDKDGNYFSKPVILNAQGSSSIGYHVTNLAVDINDGSEIKFGDFPTQDSFHLKKYYIDVFRGQCIVGYWLMEQVYQTRPVGKRYPYELLSNTYDSNTGKGKLEEDFHTGAKCHPDGFPIVVTWVNTRTAQETNMGIYAWNLKKSKEVYHANKKKSENIILDGAINNDTLFGGNVDWTQFEIRNPKSLIDVDGKKYDGDNPKELSNTDINSKKVKDYILRLSGAKSALALSNTKETFEKYFIVDSFIDYFIVSQLLYNFDGFNKNWIWCTWDGNHWTPTLYDVDSIFGGYWNGTYVIKDSDKQTILGINSVLGLPTLYSAEIKERYKQLRDKGIFSVDNITSLLQAWLEKVGYSNIEEEVSLYPDIPSYRDPLLSTGWELVGYTTDTDDYSESNTYSQGDTCVYKGYRFKATQERINVPPLKGFYDNAPKYFGFFNSVKRVSTWLTNRIFFLDTTYKYVNV